MPRENLKRTDLLQKAKMGDTISNQNRNSYKKSYKENFGVSANNLKNKYPSKNIQKTKESTPKKINKTIVEKPILVKTDTQPETKEEMDSIPVIPEATETKDGDEIIDAIYEPKIVQKEEENDVFGISNEQLIEPEPLREDIFEVTPAPIVEEKKDGLYKGKKVKVLRSNGDKEDDWIITDINESTQKATVYREAKEDGKSDVKRGISLSDLYEWQKPEETQPKEAVIVPEEKKDGGEELPKEDSREDKIDVEKSLVLVKEKLAKLRELKTKHPKTIVEEERNNLQEERSKLERAAKDAKNNISVIKSEIQELKEKIERKNKEADEYAEKIEGVNKGGKKTILSRSVLSIKQLFSLGSFKEGLQKKVTKLDEEINFLDRKLKEKEDELKKEENKIHRLEAFDIKHQK